MSLGPGDPDAKPVEPPVEPGWYNDPSGVYSHQAYWGGERWTGAVRPRRLNRQTQGAGPGWAAIVSLASGIGALATSLPFWIVLQLFVAGGMQGGFLSGTAAGLIEFLFGASSILGLSALVFGGVATGSQKPSTSGLRMGRAGMILGGVGAGSTFLVVATLTLVMFAEVFGR